MLFLCLSCQLPLLINDFCVTTQVAKMHLGFDGQARHVEIEVVRQGTCDNVNVVHSAPYCHPVCGIQGDDLQDATHERFEKGPGFIHVQVGEDDPVNFRPLQKIKSTCRALCPSSEHQEFHRCGLWLVAAITITRLRIA